MSKISILSAIGLLCAWSASAVSPNDSFANSVQLSGTNITYSGNFVDATLEPGEPHPYEIGKDAVGRYFTVTEECAQAQRLKVMQMDRR